MNKILNSNEKILVDNAFNQSEKILIVGHEHPDGDSISASLSLKFFLEEKNKRVDILFDQFLLNRFYFLPKIESSYISKINLLENYDLIIGLDYGNVKKLFIPPEFLNKNNYPPFFITFDHHPQDGQIGDIKIIHEESSSTCEIIYKVLNELDFSITKDIANCLLCGIITDTGGLQHKSVSADTFMIVGDLLEKGARPYKIVKHLFQNHSVDVLKLWGRILSRIKKDPKNLMSFSVVSKNDLLECGCSLEDLGGLVSIINTNPDTKFTLLLTETDEHFMSGSLRSEDYKGIDVSQIAKVFGGGGHRLASGFKSEENVREILKKIYTAVEK